MWWQIAKVQTHIRGDFGSFGSKAYRILMNTIKWKNISKGKWEFKLHSKWKKYIIFDGPNFWYTHSEEIENMSEHRKFVRFKIPKRPLKIAYSTKCQCNIKM